MAKMAAIMGNTSLSDRYSQTADRGVTSFHQAFYNPAFGAYGGDAGAVQSLTSPALLIGSPPDTLHDSVVKTLADDLETTGYKIQVRSMYSLSTQMCIGCRISSRTVYSMYIRGRLAPLTLHAPIQLYPSQTHIHAHAPVSMMNPCPSPCSLSRPLLYCCDCQSSPSKLLSSSA